MNVDKSILSSPAYWFYIIILLAINIANIAAPLLAMAGEEEIASQIYNFFIPWDHQWIYRSFCVFEEQGKLSIGDCIPHNAKEETITITRFTDFSYSRNYDGVFSYSRDQIGLNRGDFLIRNGIRGYKFAVCARDTGFYFALLIGSLIYPFLFTREDYFSIMFLILSAIPVGFDGTFQLLTNYESTVPFRFSTGIASGVLLGILITGNVISKIGLKKK